MDGLHGWRALVQIRVQARVFKHGKADSGKWAYPLPGNGLSGARVVISGRLQEIGP